MPDRLPTPAAVKRALRQEACFGCCVCGNPILQYHHIIPYATEAHFRVSDMMALCPNHHDEANAGASTETQQREHKVSPYNRKRGYAAGQLTIHQENTAVTLGSHLFDSRAGDLLRVGDDALIRTSLSDTGSLLLTIRLYDQQDTLLAELVENEWVSHEPLPWDIDFSYQKLAVRNGPRKISFGVDCRSQPAIIRGTFWRDGRLLRADPTGIHVDNAHMVGTGTIVDGAIAVLPEGFTIEAIQQPNQPSRRLLAVRESIEARKRTKPRAQRKRKKR